MPTASNPSVNAKATTSELSSNLPLATGRIIQAWSAPYNTTHRCFLAREIRNFDQLSHLIKPKNTRLLLFSLDRRAVSTSRIWMPVIPWGYPLLLRDWPQDLIATLQSKPTNTRFHHHITSSRSTHPTTSFRTPPRRRHTSHNSHRFMPHSRLLTVKVRIPRSLIHTDMHRIKVFINKRQSRTMALSIPSSLHRKRCPASLSTNNSILRQHRARNSIRRFSSRTYRHETTPSPNMRRNDLLCRDIIVIRRLLVTTPSLVLLEWARLAMLFPRFHMQISHILAIHLSRYPRMI